MIFCFILTSQGSRLKVEGSITSNENSQRVLQKKKKILVALGLTINH